MGEMRIFHEINNPAVGGTPMTSWRLHGSAAAEASVTKLGKRQKPMKSSGCLSPFIQLDHTIFRGIMEYLIWLVIVIATDGLIFFRGVAQPPTSNFRDISSFDHPFQISAWSTRNHREYGDCMVMHDALAHGLILPNWTCQKPPKWAMAAKPQLVDESYLIGFPPVSVVALPGEPDQVIWGCSFSEAYWILGICGPMVLELIDANRRR